MRFLNKRGQSATEYILVLALLITLVAIVGVALKKNMPGVVDAALNKVKSAISGSGGDSGGGTTP